MLIGVHARTRQRAEHHSYAAFYSVCIEVPRVFVSGYSHLNTASSDGLAHLSSCWSQRRFVCPHLPSSKCSSLLHRLPEAHAPDGDAICVCSSCRHILRCLQHGTWWGSLHRYLLLAVSNKQNSLFCWQGSPCHCAFHCIEWATTACHAPCSTERFDVVPT